MERLARPRHPLLLAVLAVALCLPALGLGFQLDDHYLRLALSRPPLDPAWARSGSDVFAFFRGDPAFTRQAREHGSLPWWAADELKLAFFRPVSGLTHALDFRLWPGSPGLMHAHSLLWLGACVAAAAALYRRLGLAPQVAGLAGLLFAIDDGHGTPAAWIANRNALVATCFGLLCLIAHHRWRGERWRPGALLAPLALLAGLLGGEMALATGGYLLAYALFVDTAPWRSRLASLAPGAAVGLAWALTYRGLGYGTRHSILYVDPVSSPLDFARALAVRAPVLFLGQWALPADLNGALSPAAQGVLWLCACLLAVVVSRLAWTLLRSDRVARFFALGLLLALVPAAATFPSNRLLLMASVGGAGLLAQWLVAVQRRADRSGLARLAFWPAVALHVVLSPLGLLTAPGGVRLLGDVPARAALSLPSGQEVARQHLLLVNTPSAFLSAQSLLEHALAGAPSPARVHVLGSGLGPAHVSRPDARALVVSPAGGYLAPPGSVSRHGGAPPALDQHHILAIFDRLYRGHEGFSVGQRLALGGLDVVIQAVTADGRPAEVRFVFAHVLEDPAYRWLQWRAGGYEPFALPPVGADLELPAPAVWPGD